MKRVVLVRHAPTRVDPARPASRWALAAGAEERVRRLAEDLGPLAPDGVVSSVEPKAIATGRILARSLRAPFRTAPGLQEHERGSLPVLEPAAWRDAVRRFFGTPDALVFGRETANEALARFECGLRRALASAAQDRPAVVTHGTVLSLFVARHNDLDPYGLWRGLQMPEALVLGWPEARLEERIALDTPA